MKIEIGNKIKWLSAAGVLEGTVRGIKLDLNAAGETIPWMMLCDVFNRSNGIRHGGLEMCANDSYLKMMSVEVV